MTTASTLQAVQSADEDFEWYPTTQRMIDVVAKRLPDDFDSLMDIGAGDGRVLVELAKRSKRDPDLYAIEKSAVLVQAQPESVTPVGTDFFEQNLVCLPVDYIFCNPPYSQFEAWASVIIDSGYAKSAFLIIPRRWKESKDIQDALKRRNAKAKVIHSDDFSDAERRARAVVDIVEVTYPVADDYYSKPQDPFDAWFDQNISTFDQEEDVPEYEQEKRDIAKIRHLANIPEMVEAFDEEYARMEENYRAIFALDYALLKELSVSKDKVREGIKARMAGLKNKYWKLLFDHLDTITNRLSTATKKRFMEKLTSRTSIAFTTSNAYTVVLWAIKNANKYFDEQVVTLFRDLSTCDGVMNYKSNQRVWNNDGWRYAREEEKNTHYVLDYRFVVTRHGGIKTDSYFSGTRATELDGRAHEIIADITAVLYNLGFPLGIANPSYKRQWEPGQWQDFLDGESDVLFQAKAHKNGNLHFRFKPEAIRALNIEAGRLLGWIRDKSDVIAELGYTVEDAEKYFGCSRLLTPSNVKLLAG